MNNFFNQIRRFLVCSLLALIGIATVSGSSHAAESPGIFPDRIVFGQSAALTGLLSDFGSSMRAGIKAAFDEVNDEGGVHGRQLILKTEDDGGHPQLSAENTMDFVNSNEIFALVGYTGTTNSKISAPIAFSADMPFIGPLSGNDALRDRKRFPNVVNLRASFVQEAEVWIEYLSNLGISRVATFYEDSALGRNGVRGVRTALSRRGLLTKARGSYRRELTAIHSALFNIRKAEPEAIAMIGTHRPSAEFITQYRSLGLDSIFLNISLVGPEALFQDLGPENSNNVIVSQVMPSPWSQHHPIVAEYRTAMKTFASTSDIDHVSLEGYTVGRLIIQALRRMEPLNLTRESLLRAMLHSGPFDLGGLVVKFDEGSNQGLHKVYLIKADKQGNIVPLFSASVSDRSNYRLRIFHQAIDN